MIDNAFKLNLKDKNVQYNNDVFPFQLQKSEMEIFNSKRVYLSIGDLH